MLGGLVTLLLAAGSLNLPSRLTPESMQQIERQLPNEVRAPAWDELDDQLRALPDSEVAEFTRAFAAVRQRAAWRGPAGLETLRTLEERAKRRGDARLAAHLHLAIGRGLIGLSDHAGGRECLVEAANRLRRLRDHRGLARALEELASDLLHHSRRPHDALPIINELLVLVESAGIDEQRDTARQLQDLWHRRLTEVDDYFGRAERRLHYFEPSLGILQDSDIVGITNGTLIMNEVADDQWESAPAVLSSFDGLFTRELRLPDDTLELRATLVSPDGVLWLGTNRGLYRLENDTLTQYVNEQLDDERENALAEALARQTCERHHAPLISNIVNGLALGPQGRLFLATGRGLTIWDAPRWQHVTSAEAPLPEEIERIALSPDGWWIAAWGTGFATRAPDGTWKRHAFEFTVPTPGRVTNNWLIGLLVDSAGHPWVHGLGGAQLLEGHEVAREVDWRFHDMTDTINDVLRTHDGSYWFATATGMCRESGATCDALGAQRWMSAPWALELFEWPDDNVWVSVHQGGIYRILPPNYRHITSVDGFVQPLFAGFVIEGGWMYFAHPAGLTRYDPKTGAFKQFISSAEGVSGDIESLLSVEGGLLATFGEGIGGGKGVALFDGERSTTLGPEDGLADETVQGVCEVSAGALLVATPHTMRLLNTASRTVEPAPPAYRIDELVDGISCSPGKPTWLTTHDGGLYRVRSGTPERLDTAALGLHGRLKNVLVSKSAGAFLLGERNLLRVTDEGFVELALDPNRFDFRVRDVLEDPAGLLYFSTESGVYITNGEDWTRIGAEDGLISDTSFYMHHFDGQIWIVGQGGVTVWHRPDLPPPETLIVVDQHAHFRPAGGGPMRRLSVSTGVASEGRVLLRGLPGAFEVESERAGPFLPGDPAAGEPLADPCATDAGGSIDVHRRADLDVTLTGATPYASFTPQELHYWYRLDDGAWKSAERGALTLTGLEDGLHVIEARATGPYLRRDETPARFCVDVDTPVPLWAIFLPFGLVSWAGVWQRRRLRLARDWLRHARGYRRIEPSPFSPNKPAQESLFVGRGETLDQLESVGRSGGAVVALCADRGLGKSSVLAALSERLTDAGVLVLEIDVALATAGADIVDVVGSLAAEIDIKLIQNAVQESPSAPGSSQPSSRSSEGTSQTFAPPSLSAESNGFRRLDLSLGHLERTLPDARVAIVMKNAEVLGLATDADTARGSFFFPFLRGLAQQHANVALFLSLEGRWHDLARRFDDLLAFATAVELAQLSREATAEGFTAPLLGRALLLPGALTRLVGESGGHPYLLQLLGDDLVALLNERATNVLAPSMVDELVERVLALPDTRLSTFWAGLSREERLLVTALCERLDDRERTPLDTVLAWLTAAGAKMLHEEARRAVVSLQRSSIVEEDEGGIRVCAGLHRRWVRARHTMSSVLEESYDYVGQYRLVERIGGGGMGVVYQARDLVRGETVAVKLLRPELSESKRSRRRFLREARLGKRLQHPNIVRILDYGDQGGRLYLAMEYLEGTTLNRWARANRARLNAAEAMRIGVRLASALEAIHKSGVLHRDIKSDNVMVASDPTGAILSVKLMDFGLAVGTDVSRMTQAGAVFGTVGYMAPEQALGKDLTQRSDLYSLGVILYELCSGKLPFPGTDAAAILRAIVDDPVPSLADRCPIMPSDLVALISDLLAKAPERRPADASEVLRRLEGLLQDSSIDAVGAPLVEPVESPSSGSTASSSVVSRTLVELQSQSFMSRLPSTEVSVSSASTLTERGWLLALHRVSEAVARGLDPEELAWQCLRNAADAVGAARGLIAFESEGGELHFPAALDMPEVADDLVERSIRDKRGFLRSPEAGARPALCAPVWISDRVLGAILLERNDEQPFDEPALEFLANVGYLLGLASERDRLHAEVVHAERLAAVGNMLAGVVHDFKNPLTVIGMYAQLAGDDDIDLRTEACGTIQRNVLAMNEMVTDLLAFARGDHNLRVADVDIAALGAEIDERLRVRCRDRRIDLQVDVGDGHIRIDGGRAKRIIINLAENAIRALKPGCHIEISVRRENDRAVLRISDDGPGIPDSVRAHMFDPFVTGGDSTGLGLAIVRRFVDDHGGSITVDSAHDKGTTFVIELPAVGP